MAKKEKRARKIKKKLLHKYRLVVLNEDTFEERFSFKLNRLNVFVFSTIFAFFLIAVTTIIIAFTPLREYIPGYSSTSLKQKATDLAYKTDSLQQELAINEQYLASIRKVLTGDVKTVDFNKDSIIAAAQVDASNVNLTPSKQDSLLREKVAREDKYNPLTDSGDLNVVFFAPVKGTISQAYDVKEKHYAVDIVTVKDAPVKAVAEGTVIFAGWTPDTGYVIIIEHVNNIISAYKHNASLNKEQGELVGAGEVIATVGNTGELTTGPHLHFELWSDGHPIDPTNFIDFE
ncbi:MAG TPA: M23 family metallopeptidase [Flavobacteriaceae bacterium]|jgi:murein DD-endopeptidase MepM/ murein hydrolase activator NlpD|nr:peptidase M23 [Flavobacteriaceae bacterium]MAM28045.1 peptidase M23 [Flavobacteriaceae bacterium]MAY53004.1 peptidase M23 [Flavobacteriaceae bacterium]HIB47451.1 M23 family metallopeptidase [Flavobacteriaceae bacterium]HIN99030.1 M23 family metallopeptidase [Flavobacteriaceae bacterium]|tara:strand:- start:148241 stop:149107 length:867 start_codon:yes stop_codon:yes gene_type:complete